MSGADDLRNAIYQNAVSAIAWQIDTDEAAIDAAAHAIANAGMELLADPVRRLALLELVGDVREGWGYGLDLPDRMHTGVGWHVVPDDNMTTRGSGEPVLVVRPRGKAPS